LQKRVMNEGPVVVHSEGGDGRQVACC
jgi:hypothetical protein